MTAALVIAGLWLAFGATHMGLSSQRLRPRLVATLGAGGFAGVYSGVALAIFASLVWFYFAHKHTGPLLWSIPVGTGLRWALYAGMGVAFVLVVGGLVQPSATSMAGGDTRVRGLHRLTRHPLFMGFGLFGLLHLVPNGWASDVAFFAGFPAFAVLGCRHQDQRKLASGGEDFRRYHAETPFLPFSGRETLRGLRELSPAALVGGIVLTVLLRWFHAPLFAG